MFGITEDADMSHDDNGNLSVDAAGYEYSYDHRSRLTEITDIAEFGYDALGRRISKYDETADTTTYYYYNAFEQVIAEYEKPDGGSEELARSFVYGNGIDEVLAMFLPERDYDPDDVTTLIDFCSTWLADSGDGNYDSDYDYDNSGVVDFNDFAVLAEHSWSLPTTTETRFYYLHDALGSVIGLVGGRFQREADREFYLYDVYGTPSETSDCGNPYFFTGRRLDPESGLYYFRFRTYDPHTGRMLQTDPIGYYDSMNLYEYVTSNPTNWVDPYGLFERLSDARPWWKTGWNWLSPGDYFSRDNLREMLERRRRQNEFDEAYRQAQRKIAEKRDNLQECLQCIEIGVELQIAVVMGTAQGVANVANGLQDSAVGLVNAVIWIGNNGSGMVPMALPPTYTLDNQVQLRYVDSRDWSYGLFMDESRLGHEVSKIVGAESAEFLIGVGAAKVFLVVKKGRNATQVADCLQDAAEEVAEQAAKHVDDAADAAKNIEKLRRQAVREAWRQEVAKVRRAGKGSRRWTPAQMKELLETGKVKGFYGHHIRSVKAHPAWAGNPRNVRFLDYPEHFGAHGSNWRTQTWGELMTR